MLHLINLHHKAFILYVLIHISTGFYGSFAQSQFSTTSNISDKVKKEGNYLYLNNGTDINIFAPHLNINNEIVDVHIEVQAATSDNNKEIKEFDYRIRLNNGRGFINLPEITEGKVSIHFALLPTSFQNKRSWKSDFNLNGSGVVDYTLVAGGRGVAMVWPAVTASAKGSSLDVFINEVSIGSTNITRGLKPKKEHQIEWRKNDKLICKTQVKLPHNVKRKCVCNEADGTVSFE